jgi:tetratricopeptide (TPR) repeat protein
LGFCKTQIGNYSGENGALVDFNKAIELNPKKVEALYGRAFTKNKLGDSRGAVEDYSQALGLGSSKHVKLVYDKKMSQNVLDDLRKGVEDKIKMAEFSLERSEIYFNQGASYYKLGNFKQAIEDFDITLYLQPTNIDAYYLRGMAQSALGDQRKAILDFSNAIKLNPKYSEAYFVRGIIKLALGDNSGCLDLSTSGELGYIRAYQVIRDFCN